MAICRRTQGYGLPCCPGFLQWGTPVVREVSGITQFCVGGRWREVWRWWCWSTEEHRKPTRAKTVRLDNGPFERWVPNYSPTEEENRAAVIKTPRKACISQRKTTIAKHCLQSLPRCISGSKFTFYKMAAHTVTLSTKRGTRPSEETSYWRW